MFNKSILVKPIMNEGDVFFKFMCNLFIKKIKQIYLSSGFLLPYQPAHRPNNYNSASDIWIWNNRWSRQKMPKGYLACLQITNNTPTSSFPLKCTNLQLLGNTSLAPLHFAVTKTLCHMLCHTLYHTLCHMLYHTLYHIKSGTKERHAAGFCLAFCCCAWSYKPGPTQSSCKSQPQITPYPRLPTIVSPSTAHSIPKGKSSPLQRSRPAISSPLFSTLLTC